jgi:hypothetical protein
VSGKKLQKLRLKPLIESKFSMHENLQVILRSWRNISEINDWHFEEDKEAINIAYINAKGVKLFSATLTRIENPSDSADVTYTLYYWGQTWNGIFVGREERLLLYPAGIDHIKTLVNLMSDEFNYHEKQDSNRIPRMQDAVLAYKKVKSGGNNSIWLRSDTMSPLTLQKRVQHD